MESTDRALKSWVRVVSPLVQALDQDGSFAAVRPRLENLGLGSIRQLRRLVGAALELAMWPGPRGRAWHGVGWLSPRFSRESRGSHARRTQADVFAHESEVAEMREKLDCSSFCWGFSDPGC